MTIGRVNCAFGSGRSGLLELGQRQAAALRFLGRLFVVGDRFLHGRPVVDGELRGAFRGDLLLLGILGGHGRQRGIPAMRSRAACNRDMIVRRSGTNSVRSIPMRPELQRAVGPMAASASDLATTMCASLPRWSAPPPASCSLSMASMPRSRCAQSLGLGVERVPAPGLSSSPGQHTLRVLMCSWSAPWSPYTRMVFRSLFLAQPQRQHQRDTQVVVAAGRCVERFNAAVGINDHLVGHQSPAAWLALPACRSWSSDRRRSPELRVMHQRPLGYVHLAALPRRLRPLVSMTGYSWS